MTSVFQVLAAEDTEQQTAKRVATRIAHKRAHERYADFLSGEDYEQRLELVKEELDDLVTATCQEYGVEEPKHVIEAVRFSFAPEPAEPRTASVHESRRPKLCPYHKEVMDISLAQGEPRAGYDAMAQHAWSANHCQGSEYEGSKCNFKAPMVTQTYWDEKEEARQERREERERERAEQEQSEQLPENEIAPDTSDEPEAEVVDSDEALEAEDNVVEVDFGGESDQGAEAEIPMGMAASVDDRSPLAERIARDLKAFHTLRSANMPIPPDLEARLFGPPGGFGRTAEQKEHLKGVDSDKRQRQYEHIKASCLESGKSEEECKELAARTVNKQRAEKGETKSGAWNDQDDPGYFPGYGEQPEIEGPVCQACGGPTEALGQLGSRQHYRCRNCGWESSIGPEPGDLRGQDSYASTKRADYNGPNPRGRPYTENELNRGLDEADSHYDELRYRELLDQLVQQGIPIEEAEIQAADQVYGQRDQSEEDRLYDSVDPFGPETNRGGLIGQPLAAIKEGEALKTVDVTQGGETPIPKIDKSKVPEGGQKVVETEGEGSPHPTRRIDILEPIDYEDDDPFDETDAVLEKQDVTKADGTGKGDHTKTWTTSAIKEALTAKDFVLLAHLLATSPNPDPAQAEHFADYLAQTNPLFDRERFIAAATGQPQTGRDKYRGDVPPVQSAVDVEKNPVREVLLEDDEDGFASQAEVLSAISAYRS